MGLCHPIKVVAQRTGLTPHAIRAWERRYGVVAPSRSGTNRRLYSEEEIERLRLLNLATKAGHSIGNIARLGVEDLRTLTEENGRTAAPVDAVPAANGDVAGAQVLTAIEHIQRFDEQALDDCLTRAAMEFGPQGMLCKMAVPLAHELGRAWEDGRLTIAHEHFASARLRNFLCASIRPFAACACAPTLVVATPTAQLHELGAVIVAAAAANRGWRAVYLGPSLPAVEISGAAQQNRAHAVALSLVYPDNDPGLPGELRTIRRCLPKDFPVLVGGRAAAAYAETLREIGAHLSNNVTDFCRRLDEVRESNCRAEGNDQ